MKFWIFMFLMDLICPIIMLVAGLIFFKGAVKKINWWCGYRTEMSMKNQETWIFAHRYCGKLWLIWGTVMLILTVIPFLCIIEQSEKTIAVIGMILCMGQCIALIASIFPTEAALKKHFDQNGNRKEPT